MTLSPYVRNMRQTAIYWPPGSPDGLGGTAYGTPVEISCRWEDEAVLFRNANGEEQTSSAVVYVDRVLENRGRLALTTFAAAVTYAVPSDVEGAREIRHVSAAPSLRADKQLNKVYL